MDDDHNQTDLTVNCLMRYSLKDTCKKMLYGCGKPTGSTMILSRYGTTTITHYWNEASLLYQFELPWDAEKVRDASIIPSLDGDEE